MHRVLIADADPLRACHLQADLEDLGIKAISVVSGEMAMAFCREYDLDLVLLDLAMGDARDAVRLLGENEMTARIPILGISVDGGGIAEPGLCGVLDGSMLRMELAQELQKYLRNGEGLGGGQQAAVKSGASNFNSPAKDLGKNPVSLLLQLSERILGLAENLKGSVTRLGPDGPEMFEFVEKSSKQMHQCLVNIAADEPDQQASRLRDREVRHDFRNILASIRGFTDLILMEEGIPENEEADLRGICDCSNQFVEWLDVEKKAGLPQAGRVLSVE